MSRAIWWATQVKRCFTQCVLLAGPAVLAGTALTAAFARWLLPYHWSWVSENAYANESG